MHFYAFGSICRGELDSSSDLDILVCSEDGNPDLPKEKYSLYKYSRLKELWAEGNPFAWHLYLESTLIFSDDGENFLQSLKEPASYSNAKKDCLKFYSLFNDSYKSLSKSKVNAVFNISCMFLAARNFATCHSLASYEPVFSRYSPFKIADKLHIEESAFNILLKARILSTRGIGDIITQDEIAVALKIAPVIQKWMKGILKANQYE